MLRIRVLVSNGNGIHKKSFFALESDRSGFTLVELFVAFALIAILFAILVPAVQQARESARIVQCRNNLHNIGLACHSMQSNTGRFPSVGKLYRPGNWSYSCLFQLLPYCEQGALHDSFNFNTHASSRENRSVVNASSMQLWHCPSDPVDSPQQSNYLGNSGTGIDASLEQRYDGFLGLSNGTRPADFTAGLSNTVAFAECAGDDRSSELRGTIINIPPRAQNIGEWETFRAACRDLQDVPDGEPVRKSRSIGVVWVDAAMGSSRYNHVLPPGANSCQSGGSYNMSIVSADSRHSRGVVTLLADGSVRVTNFEIDGELWKQLGRRSEY
jgi:type II secretory pathway pseudopilin PulG